MTTITTEVEVEVDVDLDDFSDDEIRREFFSRFDEDSPEMDGVGEIADLIAEAARSSAHAARAYSLLADKFQISQSLESRQRQIAGRMREAA